MKHLAATIFSVLITSSLAAQPAERRLAWDSMPPAVSEALHALRQTDHWLATAMAENLDGERQGRDNATGRSFNFDPARHLLYTTHDLNGDGRPEVFLLFPWPYVRGNREARGVVMVRTRRQDWRIGCDFNDWGDQSSRGGIRLAAGLSHGWRNFRTSDAVYVWRPLAGQVGAMECEPTAPVQNGRAGRALP
jgi:hypothetical protein